jgi:hypothetical protein
LTGVPNNYRDYTVTIIVTDASGRQDEQDFVLTIDMPLEISNTHQGRLNDGIVLADYYHKLNASGGFGKYYWDIYSGQLPDGLVLDNETGIISGQPINATYRSVVISVSEESNRTTFKDLTFEISEPLEIQAIALDDAFRDKPYSEIIKLKPLSGISPYQYIIDGDLPEGLSLDQSTGKNSSLLENSFLELYNATYQMLNKVSIAEHGSVTFPIGLNAGKYYFKVSGNETENQYNLKIEESTSEIEIEPNNQFQTASYLLIDNNITGYLPSIMADIDIFQVNVSNPTSLTINFQCDDNENHYSLELYKQSSEILLVDQLIIPHNQFFQYPVRLDTGKYYLTLQRTESADTSDPYQIEILSNNNFVEMEPNNTYQDASMLQEREPTYGFLSSSEDIDFFDINISETSYKRLQIKRLLPLGSLSKILMILKST